MRIWNSFNGGNGVSSCRCNSPKCQFLMMISPISFEHSLSCPQLYHHLRTGSVVIAVYFSMPWLQANIDYSMYWVWQQLNADSRPPPASLLFPIFHLIPLGALLVTAIYIPSIKSYCIKRYSACIVPPCQSTACNLTSSISTKTRLTISKSTIFRLTNSKSNISWSTTSRLATYRLTMSRMTTARLTTSTMTAVRWSISRITTSRLTISRLTAFRFTISRLTFPRAISFRSTSS